MASRKIDTNHVVKLNGENYPQWKLQVSLILKAYDLWGQVDGSVARPAATATNATIAISPYRDIAKWDKQDVEAMALIVPLVNPKQLSHIRSEKTSNEIWDKLEKMNSDSSVLNIQ